MLTDSGERPSRLCASCQGLRGAIADLQLVGTMWSLPTFMSNRSTVQKCLSTANYWRINGRHLTVDINIECESHDLEINTTPQPS